MEWMRIAPAVEEAEDWREKPVKLPVLHEDAWYGKAECCVRVATTEEDEWGSFYLDLDCSAPPPNHWLSYCFDTTGNLAEILCVKDCYGSVERMLLEHGIAPGQPFYLWASFRSWKDYWGEYDEEVDWEVTSIVPWNREKVLTEWEAFWGRKMMMGWLDAPLS
jgi:hypothetical protein